MSTAHIIYSDQFLLHQPGAFHPERPARLQAIVTALKAAPWSAQLHWQTPTPIQAHSPLEWVQRIHTPAYVQAVERVCQQGGGQLDPDTIASPDTYGVALLAVNAWLEGVDRVLTSGRPCFVLARPPGHHALRQHSMGFCVFANAAIAAHYALSQPGIHNVAILDWDVHHGNGTQAIVETHPQIRYCSLHQDPYYPHTGQASEQGNFANVLNLPLPAGSTLKDYEPLFQNQIVPWLRAFQPDLLIVSAGYDANADDPLAAMALQPEDYGVLTDYCLSLTPKILFGLEGGYDLPSLAQSVTATLARVVAYENPQCPNS
jgi:acetoin utilization deacetylase AcuC-like enzyme